MLRLINGFYGNVVQDISPWQRPTPKLETTGPTESPWVEWRLLSLETRMELWIQHEVRERRGGIRSSSRSGRCEWSVSSVRRQVSGRDRSDEIAEGLALRTLDTA